MKKSLVFSAVVIAAVALSGCKTKQDSAYRKAYEKAQQQNEVIEQQPQVQSTVVVTPLNEQPANTPVRATVDNENARQENLSLVSGSGLKAYSVVVGSFGSKANAEGLTSRLKNAGNDAQLAYNSERNMYRVIIATYADKADAVNKRNAVRSEYPDAWLLYNK